MKARVLIAGIGALVLTAAFVAVPTAAYASTELYVSPSGSDSNSGTISSPLKTIQACADAASPGTTCIMREGTYRETVTMHSSGNSGNPITFESYPGERVTVSGANQISGTWSPDTGAIYKVSATLPVSGYSDTGLGANQVFVDGSMMTEARWPNTGSDFLYPNEERAQSGTTSSSSSTSATIVDSAIPFSASDLVGSTVKVRGGYGWIAHSGQVTSASTGQFTYAAQYDPPSVCPDVCAKNQNQYYLTGKKVFLDAPKEWFYDSTAGVLYLIAPDSGSPASHVVEYKARQYAFDLSGQSYVTLHGINIFASSVNTSSTSDHIVIDGISAEYVSHFVTLPAGSPGCSIYCAHRFDSGIILAGTSSVVSNSRIFWSAGNGILDSGSGNTITNNLIQSVDYGGTYASAVQIEGANATVSGNTIRREGRDGVHMGNVTGARISYNDISHFGTILYEPGGFYSCCSAPNLNARVDHNWIHDNDTKDFTTIGAVGGAGVYPDAGSSGMTIDHNVIWNTVESGIRQNAKPDGTSSNLIYNNTIGVGEERSLAVYSGVTNAAGTVVKNNIWRGTADSFSSGAVVSNNLPSTTDPLFRAADAYDYRLRASSPAIDYGTAVSGITDGYTGTAPDAGAYETGAPDWVPGCSLVDCRPANRVHNAGFEDGLTDWSSYGSATVSPSARSGAQSVTIAGAVSGIEQVVSGLAPATTYTLSAYTTGNPIDLGVKEYGGDQLFVVTPSSSSFGKSSVTFTTGATSTSAKIFVYQGSASTSSTIDDVALEPSLVANPSYEQGLTGWLTYGTTGASTADSHTGTESVYVSGGVSGVEQVITNLSPDTTYLLQGWVKGDPISLGAKEFDLSGQQRSATSATSSVWSPVSTTFTTGSGATSAKVFWYRSGGSSGSYVDDVTLSPSLVLNGGFETGALSSYGLGGTTIVNATVTTGAAITGNFGAQLNGADSYAEQSVRYLEPNTTYTLTATGRVTSAGQKLDIGADSFDTVGSQSFAQITSSSNTPISVTFTTGATSGSARLRLYQETGTGVADDLVLTEQ